MARTKSNMDLLSFDELEKLIKKTARGAATEIAKKTSKVLKNNIEKNLYNKKLVNTSTNSYRNKFGTSNGILAKSVYYESSKLEGDSYMANVGFDIGVLQGATEPITHQSLGRYVDSHNNFVGDDLIDGDWLEEGTEPPSIVPRKGAYFMRDTENEVNEWINRGGIDSYVSKEMGGFNIVVEKG